jgi:4-amino-4-deoxy-L-arabinose transferase-like glycosyltransferase
MENTESVARLGGRDMYLALGIVALAAVLRWYNLAEWDMWTDEVQTLWTSTSGDFKEGPMYRTAPINFWLTGLALSALGDTEIGLRFVPWLAGVITIAFFLWSMPRWFGSRVGLFGGLFLALSMWHVGWSQTGRHFSLQTLLVLISMHLFLLYWLGGRKWANWGSAAFLLGGLFTHSSTAFYLAAILAFLGVGWLAAMAGESARKPSVWLKAAIPYAVAIAIYLPVFFGIGSYLVENKEAWNPPWNIVGSLLFYMPPWVLLTGLAGAFVLASRRQIPLAVLLLFVIAIPAFLVTVSSALTIASAAYCLAALPALAILVGTTGDWLVSEAGEKLKHYAAYALIVGFFLTQGAELAHYYLVYNGLKPRWSEAAAFVEQRRLPKEEFFATEGDVAQYYVGRGNARWIGQANLDEEPATGAWYAVYMGGGPFSVGHGKDFRTLLPLGHLEEIYPLSYGAKDRTLVVFYVPRDNSGGDMSNESGANERPEG